MFVCTQYCKLLSCVCVPTCLTFELCNNLYKLYYEYLELMLEYYNIYFVIKTINNYVLYSNIDFFIMTNTSIITQYKIVKVCISCHNNVN